jgi:geranylgeranyl diphosphate synthase type I
MTTPDQYAAFEDYYDEAKESIDARIAEIVNEREDFLLKRRALEHATRGGKRVRPVLTMLVSDVYDSPFDKAINHAAIVELIHNASLVADDAFDGDEERRDQSTLWKVMDRLPFGSIGNKARIGGSIMAENGLVALAFELVDDPDVAKAVGRGIRHLVDGFFMEGANVFDGVIGGGYDKYIEINRAKTGGLFALACWMPATYVDAPEEQVDAARKYGETVGLLYQVADDIADGDLPSYVQDPADELQKWHDEAVGYVDEMPPDENKDLLRDAPGYMVYRMLQQEDMLGEIEAPFLPSVEGEA